MTSSVGLNRGYLFGIGEHPYKDHVYVTHPKYPIDPFTNPKLCQAFNSSQVIVSEFEDASNEQEIAEFFRTLPERLQKCLTPSDLQKLRKTLEPMLDRFPRLKECQAYEKMKAAIQGGENDAAAALTLALFGILNSINTMRKQVEDLSSQRPLPDTTAKQRLRDRATLQSKPIVPLSVQAATSKVTDVFSLLMQEPELLRTCLFAFTQPDIMAFFSDANAFERGWHEDQRAISDTAKEKFMSALSANEGIDLAKLMKSPVIDQLSSLLRMSHMSEKIANFVRMDRRHLFFISPHTLEEWPRLDFPLTQIKIPLKPVGFLWTVRDNEGHEGILMGSMHTTAEKLVNFPRKIMELFDSSDAMAVEIDVTREDVVKRCSEVSWEKAQAKELELLSLTEKEELFQFLKSQYPDLEVAPTDEFDAQTQFLIQALRKMALQALKATVSGQKDKATNQSFFTTGIEETLMKRAKEKQIPIKDLETFDDHFINFSSESSSSLSNVVSCEQMKKIIEMSKRSLEEAVEAYCSHSDKDEVFAMLQKHPLQKMTDIMESGDSDALEVSYLADCDPRRRANLVQRNQNMAIKIDEFMKSGKKHFCVAGAMHMAGPSSIVSFLKQAGYTVERLIVEEPLETYVGEDEEMPFSKQVNSETAFTSNPDHPTNTPVISLEPSTQGNYSYWQTFPFRAVVQAVNILTWPWRKLIGQTS